MSIGEAFVGRGAGAPEGPPAGRGFQSTAGGGAVRDRLADLERIAREELNAVFRNAPIAPRSLADTGTSTSNLLNLLLKAVYAASVEAPTEVAELMKLPHTVVLELFEEAEQRQVLTVIGAGGAYHAAERRYALTKSGLEAAQAAMRRSEYIGPAPVSLDAFRQQIARQRVTNEHFEQGAIDHAFGDLVVSPELFAKLGPAINAGRSILLYGPPGNGKSSVAARIGSLFREVVYVPHCFEVDGQIVKVFDPLVHKLADKEADLAVTPATPDGEQFDRRWDACLRPIVTVGGELTLEMLDLGFNADSRFYEAPLHIKALGGVMVIDDFGRQLVSPRALLNRWITPLEERRDHLKLNSGKSFALPFDELVVFATNLSPNDLMDAAFLRRIPYKIAVPSPSPEVYREIFKKAAKDDGIEAPDAIIEQVITEIGRWKDFSLAGYQPKFIIEQIRAACMFAKTPVKFEQKFLEMALSNLHTRDIPVTGGAAHQPSADAAHRLRGK